MAAPDTAAGPAAAESGTEPPALSCAVLPSFSDACKLVDTRYSCLMVTTHTRHLTLSPRYLNRKRSGIKEQLDADLLRYNAGLDGVPVAYDNIKLLGGLGDIYDDLGYIHINIQADFVVFQPERGQTLLGIVNKVAPSHIGCLVHGCFNASIPKPFKMTAEVWQLIEVKIGVQMEFEVFQLDSDPVGVFCIRGRLSKKMEDEALKKFNEMSEEQTVDAASNETKTVPENAYLPSIKAVSSPEDSNIVVAVETPLISNHSPNKRSKKRAFQETHLPNLSEAVEIKGETDVILEEIPKKKQKKHKPQEMVSGNMSTEVDASGDHFPMLNTSLESSYQSMDNSFKKQSKKKKHQDAVQNVDIGHENTITEEAESILGHDWESLLPLSQGSENKKSKKKKSRHRSEHEDSFQNGITDTDVTESSILEESSGETGAVLETIQKKHKKKHKHSCKDLEPGNKPTNEDVPVSCEQSQAESFVSQEVTPKSKKHKRKHSDHTLVESREKNNNMLSADSEGFSEQIVKKKRK